MEEVAYICNGKNPKCEGKYGCYYRIDQGIRGGCMHTTDREYAKYRPRDPEKYPEYFDAFSYGNRTRYYEREEPK